MQNRNPYASPKANVQRGDDPEEFGEIKVFSASGRIGRVRFIGYTFGMTALIGILMAIAVGVVSLADPTLALVVAGVGYIALIVVQILLTIQRSHDFNVTGWLCLISLIPLAVLVFWFVPGTPGENDYGKPPPPNTAGAVILACILPFVVITGMLAAIAIPAYQDYVQRAASAQQSQ